MSESDTAIASILVVDDQEQNRALVLATLEEEGFHVEAVDSGEAGLRAFEMGHFDCVLLDVRMPGMSGFEVCRRLRASPRGAEIPIVFLTALRDVETFDEALEVGGDDFLTKPLRPAELLVRLQSALALRRLNAENRGYYETIREQRDAVIRLQLQKEQLTAFLVHDLKNPVNALDMQAQLLLRDSTLSERAKANARAIREEAQRLTQLITSMLDISKAEAGVLTPRKGKVDLGALASSLLAQFASRASARGVTLEQQIEANEVRADEHLLRRVLENLLDNAIRCAPEGTVVSFSAAPFGSGGDVELRVCDRGLGVAPALREAIFERYVQAEGTLSQRGSYGLGLAFCKLVVSAHGGTIWVEDGAPGAHFCVRLPDAL